MQSRVVSVITYIVATLPLFSEEIVSKLRPIIESITSKTLEELEEVVTPAGKAEVLFRTETFLDKNPRRVFDEEFVHSLNELRTQIIKSDLTKARRRLEEAESVGQTDEVAEAIKIVSTLQQKLQEKPFTTELLK
jgi:hypothetical protein